MTKLNLRYLYTAAAGAALAAAAIAIPAWGDSGGGDSGAHNQARGAPLPPPPRGTFGLTAEAPSAADARKMRSKLDAFASCMREQGADVPGVRTNGHGVSIQVPRPQSRAVMKKVAKECGMSPPPPPGQLFPSKKQMEQNRQAIARGDCPPLPPPGLQRHK